MVEVAFPDYEAGAVSVELECGGRTFPRSFARPAARPKNRIRRLIDGPREADLPDQLGEAIWQRLAWQHLSSEQVERQTLVEAYVRSLNQLHDLRRDVEAMIREACRANLEFRQLAGETNDSAREAALDEKLDEMLAEASCEWSSPRNILDAPLVSEPVEMIRTRLAAALSEAVAEFTEQFFEVLAKLVDRELFGLIEWHPNHCCSYHFFRRVLIQENEGRGTTRVIGERLFEEVTDRDPETGRQIIGTRTVEEIVAHGKHYHRLARHEHAVMNSVRTTIRNSRVVMPPQVVRLLEAIPEWLYPLVQVIDGEIFRERIIERDTRVEDWADVRVRDQPIIGCEPGVIIGRYVLTGWGPREVQSEIDRRNAIHDQQKQSAAARRIPWMTACAAALTLVALLFWVQTLRGGGGVWLVVLAATAAVAAVWEAAFDFNTARGNRTAVTAAHFTAISAASQLLLAGWLIARWLQPMSWVTPMVLAGAALIAYAVARRFQQ